MCIFTILLLELAMTIMFLLQVFVSYHYYCYIIPLLLSIISHYKPSILFDSGRQFWEIRVCRSTSGHFWSFSARLGHVSALSGGKCFINTSQDRELLSVYVFLLSCLFVLVFPMCLGSGSNCRKTLFKTFVCSMKVSQYSRHSDVCTAFFLPWTPKWAKCGRHIVHQASRILRSVLVGLHSLVSNFEHRSNPQFAWFHGSSSQNIWKLYIVQASHQLQSWTIRCDIPAVGKLVR